MQVVCQAPRVASLYSFMRLLGVLRRTSPRSRVAGVLGVGIGESVAVPVLVNCASQMQMLGFGALVRRRC